VTVALAVLVDRGSIQPPARKGSVEFERGGGVCGGANTVVVVQGSRKPEAFVGFIHRSIPVVIPAIGGIFWPFHHDEAVSTCRCLVVLVGAVVVQRLVRRVRREVVLVRTGVHPDPREGLGERYIISIGDRETIEGLRHELRVL